VVLQAKKNDDEQLCCSLSLWCGFAKVKKWWQKVTLFIVILVWSYKCKNLTMNNYIVQHCCGIVLHWHKEDNGQWFWLLV
jgi:hypothetical protein